MDFSAFFDRVKKGDIGKVYVFEGEEEYVKQSALKKLKAACLTEGMEALDFAQFESPDFDLVRAACETMPFMSTRRLVLVRDFEPLTASKKTQESSGDDSAPAQRVQKDFGQELADYLRALPETTCLVFYQTAKCDTRKKAGKALEQMGAIVSFDPMTDDVCRRFIRNTLASSGKKISPDTAIRLMSTVGRDGENLKNEMEKLASFLGEREEVTPEDIDAICTPSPEYTVFQMVDAMVSGNLARALTLSGFMLKTGSTRFSLLALLLRQYRILYFCKAMGSERVSQQEMRSALGIAPFAVDSAVRQAQKFTLPQLRNGVNACLETEYGLKNGTLSEESGFNMLMLTLSELRKQR
ncbi:MAG: DNA polymerase III subunit delta [Eubacteriales bacterium]|nr:DNA polymerase III subunit delta [Eubacteriales bacterium]MDD3881269.1 DNA polymerase III subunit delta [Eubacteriales bacterium]MDD4512187.1 DNA polymerase III subunit delta [Eubacteriales bacterium]